MPPAALLISFRNFRLLRKVSYSINMLPSVWQKVALFNPVVYLISGFRWSFYGVADVNVGVSVAAILGFMALCVGAVWWIFRTGWKLKS